MWERLSSWLLATPYSDPLERRQVTLLQIIELGRLAMTLVALPITLLVPLGGAARLTLFTLVGLMAASSLVALTMVRRGKKGVGVMFTALSMVVLLSLLLFASTLARGGIVVFGYAVPLTLAGVVIGRRALLVVLGTSVLGFAAAVLLAQSGAPGAGFIVSEVDTTVTDVINFVLVASSLAFIIDSLNTLIREAMTARRGRERELEVLSRRLEGAVRERTADLEMALGALEQRATEQEQLLDENRRQQEAIRALSVPVLRLGNGTVVLPLVGELDNERLTMVSEQALTSVERLAARCLLLDITGVSLVDTHVAQSLMGTLSAARLLGAEVGLVGVRPEVAQAIVGLGLDLGPLAAFADLQSALISSGGASVSRY